MSAWGLPRRGDTAKTTRRAPPRGRHDPRKLPKMPLGILFLTLGRAEEWAIRRLALAKLRSKRRRRRRREKKPRSRGSKNAIAGTKGT